MLADLWHKAAIGRAWQTSENLRNTMKSLATLICSFALVASAQAETVKPDLGAGSSKYAQLCVACHAADGNSSSPANPKLAGQHPEYLLKQLREFKSGKRANAIMSGMVAGLSDQDMVNIAFWLADQKPKNGYASDAELVRAGEKIYRAGVADRNIASCAGCHSPNGAGLPIQFPRLAGQHADYTAAQLKAFRSGARGNNSVMTTVAAKLNDKEIAAVSDYIAGLR
jgi:cytochrome c553